MLDDPPMLKGWDWVKKGFTATDGSLDDARFNAALLVVAYIVFAFYAINKAPPKDLHEVGQAIKDFGTGAGFLCAGVGGWFGFRKDN